MLVLTVQQPFASLIVLGLKSHETRPWTTGHRGPLLIHAGRSHRIGGEQVFAQSIVRDFLAQHGYHRLEDLPHGYLLGQVTLTDAQPAWHFYSPDDDGWYLPPHELLIGDYAFGRTVFTLADPRPLAFPVPMPGKPGLWEVPDAALAPALAS